MYTNVPVDDALEVTIPADKGNKNIICLKETFLQLRNKFVEDNVNNGTKFQ